MNGNILKLIRSSRLFRRFLALFIVLATVPVLALGTISLYLINTAHSHDVSIIQLQLINQKIEEIDKFFVDTSGILELTVDIDGNEIPAEQQQFILRGILDANKSFGEISFVGVDGRVSAKRDADRGEAAPVGNFSDKPEFLSALRGQSSIGDAYYLQTGPMITLTSPIRKKDSATNAPGDIIHVLVAEVSLGQLARSVEKAGLGNSGYLVLLDNTGSIIANGSLSEFKAGYDVSQINRVRQVLGGRTFDTLGDDDRYQSFFSNVAVVGGARQVPVTGWALMSEWPISDADAVVGGIRNNVILFALFALAAVILISPFFAARLVGPITKLEHAARKIQKGQFETRVDIKTGDELQELGDIFNKMSKGLGRLQELKDEFVFIAAHELRSPVTVIKGYLSMLSEGSYGKISNKAYEPIEQTMRANQRLEKLIEDLLEVARSEAGRIEIKVAQIDIVGPITASVGELEPLATENNIALTYEPLQKMGPIMADPDRVKEVIVNLAGNAIKYGNPGGWVKIRHELKENKLITHVEDNGLGISKSGQKKLFTKFFREKTDSTRDIGGTGLGLFIVKQLVDKMGGEIWVESQTGKGSRFSFSLPVA